MAPTIAEAPAASLVSILGDLDQAREIGDQHVLAMRRAFYANGVISKDEAESLLSLDRRLTSQHTSWRQFLAEAVTDYIVHQEQPSGYVTAENSDWLVSQIASDGVVQSRNGIEVLVKVLDQARFAPDSLARFALEQVRLAVVEGVGPARPRRGGAVGVVTAEDVDLIRRIIYAFGGDQSLAVSRAEAEILFAINDKTPEELNDPAWSDLFVKAIGSHILAASGYRPPPREEALRQDAWLSSRDGVGSFLGRILQGGTPAIFASYQQQDLEDLELARLERQRIELVIAEEVSGPEASWLIDRLGSGPLHQNERALLKFLKAESARIHPALAGLVEAA